MEWRFRNVPIAAASCALALVVLTRTIPWSKGDESVVAGLLVAVTGLVAGGMLVLAASFAVGRSIRSLVLPALVLAVAALAACSTWRMI